METRRRHNPTADHVSNKAGNSSPHQETGHRGRHSNKYRQVDFAPPPSAQTARYRRNIERKQTAEIQGQAAVSQKFVPSLGFEARHLQNARTQKTQSLFSCCNQCTPNSKQKFIDPDYLKSGLQDVLVVNRSSVRGMMGWVAPYAAWVLQTPVLGPLHNPKKHVLESERVKDAIDKAAVVSMSGLSNGSLNHATPQSHQVPATMEMALKQQKSKAESIIAAMSGPVYGWVVKLTSYTLFWVLRKLFRHLYVQRSHVRMLKAAQEEDVPIIFLPSHKSHVDYLLLTFVLLNIGIKIPHIAAGDNLNIPIFNWFIHHLGGWFIRRRLDSGSGRDQLYRNILQEYMEQLLKANQNMEFYIEGSRSRTGKPSLPKAGLLSVLVDAVREGAVPDILVVPCSITYDRIVERNFIRHELMGGTKRPENFLKGLKGIYALLTKSIGSVRMDFAQPFSLQEYLSMVQVSSFSSTNLTHPSTGSLLTPGPSHSKAERTIITSLSYHIVYDFISCSSIMSTNIVGFLLLTKFRHVSVSSE